MKVRLYLLPLFLSLVGCLDATCQPLRCEPEAPTTWEKTQDFVRSIKLRAIWQGVKATGQGMKELLYACAKGVPAMLQKSEYGLASAEDRFLLSMFTTLYLDKMYTAEVIQTHYRHIPEAYILQVKQQQASNFASALEEVPKGTTLLERLGYVPIFLVCLNIVAIFIASYLITKDAHMPDIVSLFSLLKLSCFLLVLQVFVKLYSLIKRFFSAGVSMQRKAQAEHEAMERRRGMYR